MVWIRIRLLAQLASGPAVCGPVLMFAGAVHVQHRVPTDAAECCWQPNIHHYSVVHTVASAWHCGGEQILHGWIIAAQLLANCSYQESTVAIMPSSCMYMQ
jgi:hypothetical protein